MSHGGSEHLLNHILHQRPWKNTEMLLTGSDTCGCNAISHACAASWCAPPATSAALRPRWGEPTPRAGKGPPRATSGISSAAGDSAGNTAAASPRHRQAAVAPLNRGQSLVQGFRPSKTCPPMVLESRMIFSWPFVPRHFPGLGFYALVTCTQVVSTLIAAMMKRRGVTAHPANYFKNIGRGVSSAN